MDVSTHGYCRHCERFMRLKKNGTLRHHGGPVGSGIWSDYRSHACAGVGETPARLLTGRTVRGVEVTGRFVGTTLGASPMIVLEGPDYRQAEVSVGSVRAAGGA